MQEMICTKPTEYRQVARRVGDRFEVDDAHVEVLKLVGHAVLPDESQHEPGNETEGTLHVKRKYTRREAA
ncbi:MAG: hypothetical protein ACTS6J_01920 [Burkholderiales bacterium]